MTGDRYRPRRSQSLNEESRGGSAVTHNDVRIDKDVEVKEAVD